jgi:hypothetical protein
MNSFQMPVLQSMKTLLISALALAAPSLIDADSIHPVNIQFKRLAAQQMVFEY